MHAWYKYPSLWPYFPSALLHFLFVEVRAVTVAAMSWHFLCHNMVEMGDLSDVKDQALIDKAVFIVFCGYAVPAVLFMLYGFYSFVVHAGAPMNVGSGAYLGWTWRLEHNRAYRVLVLLMFVVPMLVMLMVSWDIAEIWVQDGKGGRSNVGSGWKHEYRNHDTLVSAFVIPTGVMLVALVGLLSPQMPPNGWDPEQLSGLLFSRSWGQCMQPNDIFGLRLIDALWKAEHGKNDDLKDFLSDPDDQKIVMHVCREPEDSAKEV